MDVLHFEIDFAVGSMVVQDVIHAFVRNGAKIGLVLGDTSRNGNYVR
jgi:hypothetical protein